jgi:hypothetical protein
MSKLGSVGQVLLELDRCGAARAAQLAEGEPVRSVRAVMVEKRGECELPLGAVLTFAQPGEAVPGACPGLLCSLRPFVIAAALGVPSAETDGYLVSCPSKQGTVWRVQTA